MEATGGVRSERPQDPELRESNLHRFWTYNVFFRQKRDGSFVKILQRIKVPFEEACRHQKFGSKSIGLNLSPVDGFRRACVSPSNSKIFVNMLFETCVQKVVPKFVRNRETLTIDVVAGINRDDDATSFTDDRPGNLIVARKRAKN